MKLRMFYKYRGLLTGLLGALLLCLPAAVTGFVVIAVAGAFFAAAFFLRVWARMHIGDHSRGKELFCPALVQSGPYKYVKHPLYLSNFMAGVAFAFFHAGFSFRALLFCAVYGCFLGYLAHKENVFLADAHNCGEQTRMVAKATAGGALWADRYTWLWQSMMLALIFLRKNVC